MAEEMVVGLDCKMSKDIGVCEPCVDGSTIAPSLIPVVLRAVTQCWG